MKLKKLLLALAAISISLGLTGCNAPSKNRKTTFVTSCYPIHIIMMNLTDGIEDIEVQKMSESHSGCLHNFQLQSQDLKNIERSSAFVINGADMENFMDKVTEENPNVKIIDSSIGIDLINDCTEHDHSHAHEEHHSHSELNSHIWLSPKNYIAQIQNILNGLKLVDPKNSEKYEENAKNYIEKIKRLDSTMHQEFEAIKNKNIITFHNAFPYFAKEFGFNIAGIINHEPGEEPNAKEILEIIDIIKGKNINAMFVEPQYSQDTAKTIAKETGAKIYTLDPLVTGDNSKDSYINAMTQNMKTLKTALS